MRNFFCRFLHDLYKRKCNTVHFSVVIHLNQIVIQNCKLNLRFKLKIEHQIPCSSWDEVSVLWLVTEIQT